MILAFSLFAALTPNFSVYAEEDVYASLEPGEEYKLHMFPSGLIYRGDQAHKAAVAEEIICEMHK